MLVAAPESWELTLPTSGQQVMGEVLRGIVAYEARLDSHLMLGTTDPWDFYASLTLLLTFPHHNASDFIARLRNKFPVTQFEWKSWNPPMPQ